MCGSFFTLPLFCTTVLGASHTVVACCNDPTQAIVKDFCNDPTQAIVEVFVF